MEIRLWTK